MISNLHHLATAAILAAMKQRDTNLSRHGLCSLAASEEGLGAFNESPRYSKCTEAG